MNLENLQNDWRSAGRAMRLPDNNNDFDNRRRTSLQRLADRYGRFAILAFMFGWAMPLELWNLNRHGEFNFPIWFLIIFVAYFLTASIMDFWLHRGVKSIDVDTMSVETVLSKTMYYKKRHMQFMMVLLPFALVSVLILAILQRGDTPVIIGMGCGFLFGTLFAVYIFRQFMADYRRVMG